MAKGKRPLTGRVQYTLMMGGKLVLLAPWVEDAKRILQVSIFPDDIRMVREALDALEKGETEFHANRDATRMPAARREAMEKAKATRAKRRAARDAARNNPGGVRIIDYGD